MKPIAACLVACLWPTIVFSQDESREPGVTLRVFEVEESLSALPDLVADQTPNLDRLCETIDLEDEDFGGLPPSIVCHVLGWLRIERAGEYRLRLTSDDGSRLTLDGALVLDHDGPHGATAVTSRVLTLEPGEHELFLEHFDRGGARSLKLEWQTPGAQEFTTVPTTALRAERDLTRVTSPGKKRVSRDRRAGDGRPLEGVHPGYELVEVRPEGFEPKVGAMTFVPDGRLVVGLFDPLQRDDRSLPDIESKEPDGLYALTFGEDGRVRDVARVATDLFEPSGACVVDGDLYVAHRRAIERLLDTDGDGFFETHELVGSGWEAWNYHQFTFGLVHRAGKLYSALSTSMAPPAWEGMQTNAGPNGPMRGGILEVDLSPGARGDARVIAGGTRTPNGLGLGPAGELLYLDNQGAWMSTSQLAEVVPGRFFGHHNWTRFVPKLKERFPEGGHPSVYCDRPRAAAAVYMPQNEVSNSPTQPQLVTSGPFAGQMLVGELTAGGIRRVFLERVNGQLQGALMRFSQGLECGVNRMRFGPDGSIWTGGIGAGGNWNWRGTQHGLQRLRPTGVLAFEMLAVRARPEGFEIEFTKPVDPDWLADHSNYLVKQWHYEPTAAYGGPKIGTTVLGVRSATPTADGLRVRLDVEGLERGSCVHLRCDPVSREGESIWSTEAWYTLNQIPRAEPGPREDVGLGQPAPEGAVTLIGSSSSATLRYEGAPERPTNGGPDELRDAHPWVEVGNGSGNLVTNTSFGDARLHVEWYCPPGGQGQVAGNSGVYLHERYELQILGTLPGDEPLQWNEAGSIYERRAPDRNASTGPGTWQAYDIWFRAPRFEAGRKVADARVTVYWNGHLVHDDVAIEPTGSGRALGEDATRPVQLGRLRLQDHVSDAEGPVRYRNVWIAPLEPVAYAPGEWVDLFEEVGPEDWLVRGGDASFVLEDGVLRGATRPHTPNSFFTSRETFADFELLFEARVHPELNSGVQVRSEVLGGIDERSGALRGPQVELDPSPRAWSAGIYDERGRGWLHPLHSAPYARRAYRLEGWNRIRVVAEGPVLRTWINGVPAAEIFDAVRLEGHLGFQVHGVGGREDELEVSWRNARIRRLSPR